MLQYTIKYRDKTMIIITDANKIVKTIPMDKNLIGANFNSSVCQRCMTILDTKRIDDI
jgi:hypothetical protein